MAKGRPFSSLQNVTELKKKARRARSSESLPTGLLCNQYNQERDSNPRYGFGPSSEVTEQTNI